MGPHPPVFFVSVASKGLSPAVSLLFATLAGKSISVAAKGFRKASRWRESNWNGREEFEGVRRTAWRTSILSRHGRIVPINQTIIAYWYRMSRVTYKWFRQNEMARPFC